MVMLRVLIQAPSVKTGPAGTSVTDRVLQHCRPSSSPLLARRPACTVRTHDFPACSPLSVSHTSSPRTRICVPPQLHSGTLRVIDDAGVNSASYGPICNAEIFERYSA